MNKILQKSVFVGLICYLVLGTFSFLYGGIYTEIFIEGNLFSFQNLFISFLGAYILIGPIGFFPGFVLSLAFLYMKNRKTI